MATTANSTVKLTKYQNLQKTIASAEEKFILKGVLRCVTVIGLFHLLHTFFLFSSLSDDRSEASSKTIPPHSAIQSLLFQMRLSSPVLKVVQ